MSSFFRSKKKTKEIQIERDYKNGLEFGFVGAAAATKIYKCLCLKFVQLVQTLYML